MKHILIPGLGLLLAIIIFGQSPSVGQTHNPSPRAEGELKGLVLDSQGARIVGAKITLQNRAYMFETQSNEEGAFQVRLPVGEYQLTIESSGFKGYTRKSVRIEADKTETISVTMQPSRPAGLLKVR